MIEEKKPSLVTRVSLFFGRIRGLYFPLALFSVLAIGLHVGSDRVDDHLFVLFNAIDAAIDSTMSAVIREVFTWFGASTQTIETVTFRAVDLIDLDTKATAARFGALVVELLSDVLLALPVFFYRSGDASIRTTIQRFVGSLKEPTVLKIAAPIAVSCASLAGVFAVSREIQVGVHALAAEVIDDASKTTIIAAVGGLVALFVVLIRIAAPAVLSTIGYAERIASNDRLMATSARRRRMRGIFVAVVALPIAILAIDATSIVGGVRALIFW
jgi:hypothetical protein